jgi:hypothetical protein
MKQIICALALTVAFSSIAMGQMPQKHDDNESPDETLSGR